MNGLGVEEVFGLESLIPDNVALGTEDCLKRCGITRPATPATAQRQPRVAGNAYPSGIQAGPIPTPTFIASAAASAAASVVAAPSAAASSAAYSSSVAWSSAAPSASADASESG